MAEGLSDEKIIDQIITGGQKSFTQEDIFRLEEEKMNELLKQGVKPVNMDDMPLFGSSEDSKRFEDF